MYGHDAEDIVETETGDSNVIYAHCLVRKKWKLFSYYHKNEKRKLVQIHLLTLLRNIINIVQTVTRWDHNFMENLLFFFYERCKEDLNLLSTKKIYFRNFNYRDLFH